MKKQNVYLSIFIILTILSFYYAEVFQEKIMQKEADIISEELSKYDIEKLVPKKYIDEKTKAMLIIKSQAYGYPQSVAIKSEQERLDSEVKKERERILQKKKREIMNTEYYASATKYIKRIHQALLFTFFVSLLFSLIIIILKIIYLTKKYIHFITKTKLQRIGCVLFIISIFCFILEYNIYDEWDFFPLFSCILFCAGVVMISTLPQKVLEWVRKGE